MSDEIKRHIKAQNSAAELLEQALKRPGARAIVRDAFRIDPETPPDMEETLRRIH